MNASWWRADLVWEATAWLLGAIGLGMLVWAMFWDRARGRKRCPSCWYDMGGAVQKEVDGQKRWVCPECGRGVAEEGQLLRTRRRWDRGAAAAVVMLGAYVVFAMPRVIVAGWAGLVPTSGLIYVVGRYEPPEKYDGATGTMSAPTWRAAELARRVAVGTVWGWQSRWMVSELGLVQWREQSPRGRGYKVVSGVPSWMQSAGATFKTSTPMATEAHYDDRMLPWEVSLPAESVRSIPIEVSLGSWKGKMELPVRLVDKAEDAMEGVQSAALDAAVKRALDCSIRTDSNAQTKTGFMIGARLYRERGPVPADLAMGLVVELVRDGEVKMTWRASLRDSPFGEPVDWMRFSAPDPGWGARNEAEIEHWTMRVRGDAGESLVDFARKRYWAGAYEVPLKEAWK